MTKSQGILILILGFLLVLTACKKEEQNEPQPDLDIFDIVWNDFDRTYPYFIHKNIDWDSVQEVYSAKINESIFNRDLFELIGEMTLILEDIHVYLNSSYGKIQFSKKENYPENPPDLAIDYLDQVSVNNSRGIFGKIAN